MANIFISYSEQSEHDVAFAEELRQWLHTEGHTTWMARHDIPPGANVDDAIHEGLKAADVVLGIMTAASVEDDATKNEWAWALQKQKLQLIEREECRIPHRFIRIQRLDFTSDDPARWQQLSRAIEATRQASAAGIGFGPGTNRQTSQQETATQALNSLGKAVNDFFTGFMGTAADSSTQAPVAPPPMQETRAGNPLTQRNTLMGMVVVVLALCMLLYMCSLLSTY